MANITLWGASYPGVPAIDLPQTGGGTVRFYENSGGGGTIVPKTITENGVYNAADDDADGYSPVTVSVDLKKWHEYEPLVVKLKDSDFNGWTPSTSVRVILPTQTIGTFVATDITEHDYYIRQRIYADIQYTSGTATAKGMFRLCAAENWNIITRRASTATTLNQRNRNNNLTAAIATIYLLKYYNTSWTNIYSSAYGIYPSNASQSISSTTAVSPTVTVKSAIINAKCQATYFSTGMAAAVDQDASTITIKTDVYQADIGYFQGLIYESLMNMWNDGL